MTAKHPPRLWSPLPTARQLALLRLVLSPDLDLRALESWSRGVNVQALDEGTMRLLPSLYSRLKSTGIDHPLLPIVRSLYCRSLYRNRLLLHRGLAVVKALSREGISCLLLKGAALGLGYYPHLGERPMGDIDILVPDKTAPESVHAVMKAGKAMNLRDRALHAHTYLDRDGLEYDIHWHLLPELAYAGSSRTLWERAETIPLERENWLTLCPEDHVFHILAHGLRVSNVLPLRWIVDTATVLRAKPEFDWGQLVEQTRLTATTVPVTRGLSFLVNEGFVGDAGAQALRSLKELPTRRVDRYVFAGQMHRPSLGYSILRPFLLYCRLRRLAGEGIVPSFARFIVALWDLQSSSQIPRALLGKFGAKLLGRRPGSREAQT